MITLTQTESTLSLSANIRPKGYEGAEFVPEGLTVEVVGRNNGALLQHLNGNIEGDRLSVDIDLDDVQDVDIYDLVINYRLRDARYIRGYRAVNIIETAFEARRSENTSILGGGNTARATVITPVASEDANAGGGATLDLSNLSPEQVEALKQALGISETAGEGQELDLANLKPEQVEALKQALGINANASQGAGQADFSALSHEQVEALKDVLGINYTNLHQEMEQYAYSYLHPVTMILGEVDQLGYFDHEVSNLATSSDVTLSSIIIEYSELIRELGKRVSTSRREFSDSRQGLAKLILDEPIVGGSVFDNWNTRFEAMNRVQVDGFGASSSAGVAEYIELLAKAVNRLVERVDRLEAGQ